MAAAVLELGREEASPREKMFENLVDCVVAASTATHPAASAIARVDGTISVRRTRNSKRQSITNR